jgi:hypothetical protein
MIGVLISPVQLIVATRLIDTDYRVRGETIMHAARSDRPARDEVRSVLKTLTGILVVAALLLAGCTSTPQASRERDAQAKEFVSHPNASTIYVYRNPFDQLEDLTVLYIDERLVGETLPGAYFRIDTTPGKHVLHGVGIDSGRIALETRAGTLYFVELSVAARVSTFREVPEALGRKRIVECCALLENWAPGQRPLLK